MDRAVRVYQKKNGLEADGIVGPKTLAKINVPKGGTKGGTKGGAPDSTGGARGRGDGGGGGVKVDVFDYREKKNDVARQRKLKSDIDKLHAQAEQHRTSMEASLSSVESVRKKGYEAITSAADKMMKLMNW